jgi:hypothetical protein
MEGGSFSSFLFLRNAHNCANPLELRLLGYLLPYPIRMHCLFSFIFMIYYHRAGLRFEDAQEVSSQ